MGCGGSKQSAKKVYATDVVDEVKAKMAAFDQAGKGCPVGSLNDALVAIGAERLDEEKMRLALPVLDADGTGFVTTESFLLWFRTDDDEAKPSSHPSVAAGVKEEGDVGGAGLCYDAVCEEDCPAPATAAVSESVPPPPA